MHKKSHQVTKELTPPALAKLNPEAGSHPMPDDPREIMVATSAGEQVLAYFPYLTKRFGERGRRFTASDSAWLVTLTNLEISTVLSQVIWLGGVLSGRGIPRIVLEIHLGQLYHELCRINPPAETQYKKLIVAADHLRERRLHKITSFQFDNLAEQWERGIAAGEFAAMPHMGELIIGAVADESDGVSGSVSSLESWLCDAKLFSGQWISMVKQTITDARGLMVHG